MATPATQLKEYRRKRNFSKTAEPSGETEAAASNGGLRFVVQKHAATRLHYDFRLELDGVLKSWAVTKGPSANPTDKRLAVRVEDHPLDYGGFEGAIPKAEYGGGTVMLWDEGTWEPIGDPHDGLVKGDLKFRLKGKRMKGEWMLVHMKGRDTKTRRGERENWLLIKHRDRYATDGEDGLTEKFVTSVETGRDLDGIAKGTKPKRKTASARLVGEVAHTEVTPDGSLRHPSFIGLRKDTPAREVKLETPAAPSRARTRPKARGKARALQRTELTDAMGLEAAERLHIRLTHPDKVVYEPSITKAQLVAYYDAVKDRMLPHVARRPLSLLRLPTGSHKPFFQKHDSGGFPEAFKKVRITETTGPTDIYLYIEDEAGLAASVQMNAMELHIWGSHIDWLEQPDRIIFDIDPDEGLDFAATRQAARDIRDRLGDLGLKAYAMVTGGKGIHVIAPLKPTFEWPQVKAFCHAFADRLAADEPERFTSNIRKAKRTGRMFVDYLRNERGATAVCPFSTRAKPGASCAVPLAWDELDTIEHANVFSIAEAAARAAAPDPWPDYFTLGQTITPKMLSAVGVDKAKN